MLNLSRSFYAKVFLMFMAGIMTLYVFNQSMIAGIADGEMKRIVRDRMAETSLQWSEEHSLPSDPMLLRGALMQALHLSHPEDVMIFTAPLDATDAHKADQLFLPDSIGTASVSPDPVTANFPKLSHATVMLDGQEWKATRLIAPYGIVVSLVNAAAGSRQVDGFLEFRARMVRQVFPFTLLVTIIVAIVISYRVLAPVKRIQKSLRSLDSRDLATRIPTQGEDNEFREFIQVFNTMLERLERGFLQASRFSSDAAHELRTPLTIMQGHIEQAITEAVPGSRLQAQLSLVGDEIERLASITQKLLLLAQADAGRLKLDIETVNVSHLLEEMRQDIAMLDPPLEMRGSVENNLMFDTDPALFQQMLNNLFSNAVKYNEPDGWMDISAWSEHGRLHIRFSNPTQPLSDEFCAKVFERFSRGDASHSRRIDGTGLGLSLCREIAVANGGSLTFSTLGQTVVIVEFMAPLGAASSD